MLKYLSNGQIADGSEYTKYYTTASSKIYIVVQGAVYVTDTIIDDLSKTVIVDGHKGRYLLTPIDTASSNIAHRINDTNTFIQRKDIIEVHYDTGIEITINDQTFQFQKRDTGKFSEEYLYCFNDNKNFHSLLGYTIINYGILIKKVEGVLKTTEEIQTPKNVIPTDYDEFMKHYLQFQNKTMIKVVEQKGNERYLSIKALNGIMDNIISLKELYSKK